MFLGFPQGRFTVLYPDIALHSIEKITFFIRACRGQWSQSPAILLKKLLIVEAVLARAPHAESALPPVRHIAFVNVSGNLPLGKHPLPDLFKRGEHVVNLT